MRQIAVLALLLAPVASHAQSKAVPYVISIDGVIAEVAHDFEGLQPYAEKKKGGLISTKGCVKATASQNTQSLRLLSDSMNGIAPPATTWTVHRALPNGAGVGGGQVSFPALGVDRATLPALDSSSKEAAFFELELDTGDVNYDGSFTTSPAEKAAVKGRKQWLPSNFRLSLGDLPMDRVKRVGPITLQQAVADLDGDGILDSGVLDPIVLTLPLEDAGAFSDWFDSHDPATPTVETLVVEYLDSTGEPVFVLTVPVVIDSYGFSDVFLGPDPSGSRPVQVGLRAVGILHADG